MSSLPKGLPVQPERDHSAFLEFLPAVQARAAIQFRHMPASDREEAMAEAAAAAFVNVRGAVQKGKSHSLKPAMVAHFAVLHVKDGRHIGGQADSKCDVLSRKAQRRGGFQVLGLPWDHSRAYNCLTDPTAPIWNEVLLGDKSTSVPDQAAFRIDWSGFLGGQTDRTRQAISMLAEGHRQVEVAEQLGVTPTAVCQRVRKAEREWNRLQADPAAVRPSERKPATALERTVSTCDQAGFGIFPVHAR